MGWGMDAARDLVNDDEILEGHGALEAVEGREQRLETVDLRAVRGGVDFGGEGGFAGSEDWTERDWTKTVAWGRGLGDVRERREFEVGGWVGKRVCVRWGVGSAQRKRRGVRREQKSERETQEVRKEISRDRESKKSRYFTSR